jgi:hypothetical protein
VQPRLASLEQRLAGTFNLAGHLVAVADMAGELGVPLPDLDASGGRTAGAAIAAHGRGAALSSAPGSAPAASGSSTRLAGLHAQLEASRAEARALKAELQVGQPTVARISDSVPRRYSDLGAAGGLPSLSPYPSFISAGGAP